MLRNISLNGLRIFGKKHVKWLLSPTNCSSLSITLFCLVWVIVGFTYINGDKPQNTQVQTSKTATNQLVILPTATREYPAARDNKTTEATEILLPQDKPITVASLPLPKQQEKDPIPRIKPANEQNLPSVPKAILIGDAYLSDTKHYGFADQRDFTGGKPALFTEYIPTKSGPFIVSQKEQGKLLAGESLYAALIRLNIKPSEAEKAAEAINEQVNVRTLRRGTLFSFIRKKNRMTEYQEAASLNLPAGKDELVRLTLENDPVRRVTTYKAPEGKFISEITVANTTLHYATISGTIVDSLFASAQREGAPREVVAKLANLFLFDVDFQREIYKGDRFELVYEVFYDELGRPVGYGDVVYGELSWRANRYSRGYYRHNHNGKDVWFDAGGKSARRLLMKTPIEGARITSGFGRRKHPVLGYTKKHKGVDFGARRGSPIMAAGDGVIQRANRFGSFGNYVKIKHANGYQTAYAHLKGFASGIKKGTRVRQGQVIGYVGTTGRSTGPHLHYEVLRNGKQVNPMRIKVATGEELTGNALESFSVSRKWADSMREKPAPMTLASN